jgi:hypothetical protein
LLVDGLVAQAAEVHWLAIGGTAAQVRVADFGGKTGILAGWRRLPRAKRKGTPRPRACCQSCPGRVRARRQEGQHIRPFPFTLSEAAKRLPDLRPAPETPREGALVEVSREAISATGRDFMIFASRLAPILQ